MAALMLLVASPSYMLGAPRSHVSAPVAAASVVMQQAQERAPFKLALDLGKNGKGQLKFKPSVPSSEAVVVRYKVPFGLNVENQNGKAICTKDGKGGERVGDILSEWTPTPRAVPSALAPSVALPARRVHDVVDHEASGGRRGAHHGGELWRRALVEDRALRRGKGKELG